MTIGNLMTKEEFEKKRASIATSLAHPRVKTDAMNRLTESFYGTDSVNTARQQIEESKADTSDIGGHDA